MNKLKNLVWNLRIIKDTKGQDLIEYALMAGFVAVAAGAIMPNVASSISVIFSKVRAPCRSPPKPVPSFLTRFTTSKGLLLRHEPFLFAPPAIRTPHPCPPCTSRFTT